MKSLKWLFHLVTIGAEMKYVPEERYSQQKKRRWGAPGWRRDNVPEFANPTEICMSRSLPTCPGWGLWEQESTSVASADLAGAPVQAERAQLA